MAKEKRLIDANALETAIQGTVSQVALDAPYDPEWFTRLAARQFEILKIIDDAPTVDAVEVVRCKECKYYDACELTCELLFNPCATNVAWYPEDFCSYGERKDNGENM